MSSSLNDTEIAVPRQGADWNEEEWHRLLQERLPSDWQEQAVKKKAWQRTRKLASVEDLLRGLLVYVACGFSFRQLGIWATLVGLGSLSERAWRKRVQRAGEWIVWLMGALIGTQQAPGWLHQTMGRVLLIDGTRLGVPAGTGDDARLHSAYDLRAGRLVHVEVTDRHSAEGLHHFNLGAGDITVTDAGYQVGACVQQGHAHGAFGVHRVSDHQVRFEREDGKKIDLKRLVKRQGYGTVTQRKVWVWDPKHQQRFEVCLVIETLPRKQAMQARERPSYAYPAQTWPQAQHSFSLVGRGALTGDNLTTGAVVSPRGGKTHPSRGGKSSYFSNGSNKGCNCICSRSSSGNEREYTCICVWSCGGGHEQEAQLLHEQLSLSLQEPEVGSLLELAGEELQEPMWVISSWGLMRCQLDTLRTLLHGSWPPHRLQECLPQLRRYLVTRQRKKRVSQESEVRAWLSQRLAKPTTLQATA